MRTLLILLLMIPMAWGQEQEDEKTLTIGTFTFTLQNEIWQHDALPDEQYEIERENACEFEDEKWKTWYEGGDDVLRAILELQNVVFQSVSSVDNKMHIYCVLDDDDKVDCAVDHGREYIIGEEDCGFLAAWLTPEKVILGTTGVIGAVIIIDNVGSDDEASPTRKK